LVSLLFSPGRVASWWEMQAKLPRTDGRARIRRELGRELPESGERLSRDR
jgi:hypothetical protein